MERKSIIKFFIIVGVIGLLYCISSQYINFEMVKQKSIQFRAMVEQQYVKSVIVYIFIFALCVSMTIPVALPMALGSGYLFGTFWGGIYTTIATTVGCMGAFLLFRHVFGKILKKKFGNRIVQFNKRITKYGPNYLLLLHYSTIFPYFIINSFASLTTMSFWVFLRTTVLGCLPLAFIYAFAGRQLSSIHTMSDIFSFEVMIALILLMFLALMPIIIKRFKGSIGI